jgi:hypothetical protein
MAKKAPKKKSEASAGAERSAAGGGRSEAGAERSVSVAPAPVAPATTDPVSAKTLNSIPQRALKFLRGVGTTPGIFQALGTHGYTEDDHQEGWNLLKAAGGYVKAASSAGSGTDNTIRAAIATLGKEGEAMLRVLRAAIQFKFPQFMSQLFDGMESSSGPGWVLVVQQLLERIDDLAQDGDDGEAALQLIADRGYGDDQRAQLADLVATAQSLGPAPSTPPPDADAHTQALTALYQWYAEWAQIAKVVITRRDWLILMGLATRKVRTQPAPAPTPAPTPAPAPSPTVIHGLPAAPTNNSTSTKPLLPEA